MHLLDGIHSPLTKLGAENTQHIIVYIKIFGIVDAHFNKFIPAFLQFLSIHACILCHCRVCRICSEIFLENACRIDAVVTINQFRNRLKLIDIAKFC